mmetsp:Transcript_27123/g.23990  ORF Transcript_27123/g.23990 Transcript_27123/m.23990 type:complete len:161 (+) Transcript_27123:36-518(+)
MANKSEKKNRKKMEEYSVFTNYFIDGVNVLYILSYLWAFFSNGDAGLWDLIIFGIFTLITKVTHKAILNAKLNDYGFSYYQDVFIINLFIQFLAIFCRKSLYLYLLIPMYLIYAFGGYILAYFTGPSTEAPEEELTDAERRKMKKKKAKEERGKTKYVKG